MSWNIKTPGDYINGPLTVAGSATITGALTVDTTTLVVNPAGYPDRVGIGTATPAALVDVNGAKDATNMIVGAPLSTVGGVSFVNYSELLFKNTAGVNSDASIRAYGNVWNAGGSQLAFFTSNNGALTERFRLYNNGVATWSNVDGGSGTAMTLNSNGLGVGGNPISKVFSLKDGGTGVNGNTTGSAFGASHAQVNADLLSYAVRCTGGSLAGIGGQAYATQIIAASAQANALEIYTIGAIPLVFGTSAAERARIDASGNWLVGVSTVTTPGVGNTVAGASIRNSGDAFFSHASSQALYLNTNVDGQIVSIRRSNVAVGSISVTTSSTAYNTSSDYRLKESVQPLAGGLDRVSALKPSIYKWKADGSSGEGFLAHELAAVIPSAVTGEKDATNADGSIKPQGVDLSKVVPVLVAAIQELAAEVAALKNA